MIALYDEWTREYPIVSIEDGLAEGDWPGWAHADDGARRAAFSWSATTCSSPIPAILKEGIEQGIGNSLLVKVNQIGTVSETLDAMAMAWEAGYTTIASHRSGETEDSTIADLAVGTRAGQIKTGSLCRSDRVAKYNQLLRIEEALGSRATYAGRARASSSSRRDDAAHRLPNNVPHARLPHHPRRLGPARRTRPQRRRARQSHELLRSAGALSQRDARRVRRSRRPARRPDGQLRGRPHQPRRRTRRLSGPDAHRQEHPRRRASSTRPALHRGDRSLP